MLTSYLVNDGTLEPTYCIVYACYLINIHRANTHNNMYCTTWRYNPVPHGMAFVYTDTGAGFNDELGSLCNEHRDWRGFKRGRGREEQFRKSFPANNCVRKGAGEAAFIRPKSLCCGDGPKISCRYSGFFYGLLMFVSVIFTIA